MSNGEVEIVLVEDNPNDAELITRSLKKHNLANKIVLLKDGAEALEFLFGQGCSGPKSGSRGSQGRSVGHQAPQGRWHRGPATDEVR